MSILAWVTAGVGLASSITIYIQRVMIKRRNKKIRKLTLAHDRLGRESAQKEALLEAKVAGLEEVEATLNQELEVKNELLRKANTPSAVAHRLSQLFVPPETD